MKKSRHTYEKVMSRAGTSAGLTVFLSRGRVGCYSREAARKARAMVHIRVAVCVAVILAVSVAYCCSECCILLK